MRHDGKDSDSDYQPVLKQKRNKNIGLREPSKTRLLAQDVIRASKSGKSLQCPLPLPDDEERNKQCPHCTAKFYYHEGLKAHLSHAHANILIVKGINTPPVMGINNTLQPK